MAIGPEHAILLCQKKESSMQNVPSSARPSSKRLSRNLALLVIVAFVIRASVFFFYMQYNERYKQADSVDYHNCALVLGHMGAMVNPSAGEPIFWRTPGYPAFLVPFYVWHGIKTSPFGDYASVHKVILLIQIFLCSFIPVILFYLAQMLTGSLAIAWITSWIAVFHLGFILASTYILTDALASIFFYFFLIFFFKIFSLWGLEKPVSSRWVSSLIIAALSLGVYTWMRPMGKNIGVVAVGMLILLGNTSWSARIKKGVLFGLVFFASLAPWIIRNYNLTGQAFFCPMSGTYLSSFCAPKLMRRATGMPYRDCLNSMLRQGFDRAVEQRHVYKMVGSPYVATYYLNSGAVAWPWIIQYPWYFIYDWTAQVLKTTLDLYSSQLVALARNSFWYDPLEEFLYEKLAACLYEGELPLLMRIIAWFEFFFHLGIIIALCIGTWLFVLWPLIRYWLFKQPLVPLTMLWIKTGLIIGAALVMTGGFGYARLRIPVEPLMIILALTFYFYLFNKQSNGQTSVRPLA